MGIVKLAALKFLLLILVVPATSTFALERHELPDGTFIDGVEVSTTTIPRGTLTVLGLTLAESSFVDVRRVLGAADILPMPHDPHQPDVVCYSIDSAKKVYVYLSGGWPENPTEKLTSFSLSSGATRYDKNACASSSKVTRKVNTANGLRLGVTQTQLTAILGKPGKATPDWIVYSFQNYRVYSKEERAREPRAPDGSESKGEYIYNYVFAHFTSGKLDLLEVSAGGEPDW